MISEVPIIWNLRAQNNDFGGPKECLNFPNVYFLVSLGLENYRQHPFGPLILSRATLYIEIKLMDFFILVYFISAVF